MGYWMFEGRDGETRGTQETREGGQGRNYLFPVKSSLLPRTNYSPLYRRAMVRLYNY